MTTNLTKEMKIYLLEILQRGTISTEDFNRLSEMCGINIIATPANVPIASWIRKQTSEQTDTE